MLELEAENSGAGDGQFKPPKYISLRGTLNTFGRGYKANIRMPFSWLSRNHATITRVDGNCIIEAHGQNGVFVNSKRIEFTTLNDGDKITFGGGTRNAQIGSILSSPSGSHMCYVYHKSAKDIDTSGGNWYCDPSTADDIMQIEDVVNGQNVTQCYNLEDFNCTDELTADDCVVNLTEGDGPSSATTEIITQVPQTVTILPDNTTPVTLIENSSYCHMESCSNPPAKIKEPKKGKGNRRKQTKNFVDLDNNGMGINKKRQLRQRKSLANIDHLPDGSCMETKTQNHEQTQQVEMNNSTVLCADSDPDCCKEKTSFMRSLRKRKHKSYPQYILNDDEGSESDEFCPDGDIPESPNNNSQPVKKKLKLSSFQSVTKGKGKKISGRQNKKKGKHEEIDEDELRSLNSWYNKGIIKPAPRMVEILNGPYQRHLYAFNDKELFQVVYKNGEDLHNPNLLNSEDYNVIVYLDAALFEYKVKLGQLEIEDFTKVLELVNRSSSILNINDYDQPTPAAKLKRITQPEAISLPLKQYQLDTLGWMYHLELEVGNTWKVSKLVDWPEADVDIAFDLINKRAFCPPVPEVPSTEYRINIKGGILADEMGLGKTVTVLSLIVAHQDTDSPTVPTPTVFHNGQEMHLPTKATLVVAPSHLTAQWKEEAEKHAPGLNVLLITTKPQFEKYRYVDILRADLVVVSVQFLLTNKTYTTLPAGVDAEASFMRLLHKPGINPLLEKCPNLGHFNWWRLVCDEAHELITYKEKHKKYPEELPSNGLQKLEKLTARHKWYMTGTPLPHKEKSLRGALKFLEMKVDDQSLMYRDGSLKIDEELLCFGPIHRFILDTIYVRNTKQSIGTQYSVPEYVEELMLLTMSDVERGIYDSASNSQEKRQLCCHLQIATRVKQIAGIQQKSLDEVKDAMIAHTKSEIHRIENCIIESRKDIRLARDSLMEENKSYLREILENRIKRYQEKIVSNEDTVKKLSSSLSYFENIAPRITQSADEPCVICLDNIVSLTVTPCGHLFCKKCIIPCVQQQEMCPTCRKHITESELVEVKDQSQRENLNRSAELQKLTEQFGTKMAYLIFYLRYLFKADPNSRVIIFSQWDELLHKIGSTLNEHGIRNVFVKGNVHVRNKAILSFRKQEKTRVIMLSLQNAASGTNLVEASHVILIDPVAGSKEEATSIEAQAIGRAHRMGQDKEIKVIRMIVKDTLEHELYLRNNSENIQQMELAFDEEDTETMGVQVIRKVRKIPKPKGISANTSSVFAGESPSTSGISRPRSASYGARSRGDSSRRRSRANNQRLKVLLAMQQFWGSNSDSFF